MINKIKKSNSKSLFLVGITIFLAVIFSGLISAVCCEKTVDLDLVTSGIQGGPCMDIVSVDDCDDNFRIEPNTACESTTYCSIGTCVDNSAGTCKESSQSKCDPALGGYWYNKSKDEVNECRIGCCLIGEGASVVEQTRCYAMAADYGVENPDFYPNIQDTFECLSLASPRTKGACVLEMERGRTCTMETKSDCQDASGEFNVGFLCSAPELGTICSMTKRTKCVEGKHEVYYVDSCGNLANVYWAEKITDVNYWTYTKDITNSNEVCGVGDSNSGSKTCGNCNYIAEDGSTCGRGNADYGDYICKDLSCTVANQPTNELKELVEKFKEENSNAVPKHGEEWCSEPIINFENALPGKLSYRLYCYNGEVQYEPCDHFRNKLCLEDETEGSAGCVINNWASCYFHNSTRTCEESGDCRIEEGAAILRTSYGTEKMLETENGSKIIAACVPKYPGAFKFWDPAGTIFDLSETPSSVCEFGSVMCLVNYTQEIIGLTNFRAEPLAACVDKCVEDEGCGLFLGWDCRKNCRDQCTPVCLATEVEPGEWGEKSKLGNVGINSSWANNWQDLCTSLGDCGVKGNYLGKEGYNSWRDLFIGEKIDWSDLPNANKKK